MPLAGLLIGIIVILVAVVVLSILFLRRYTDSRDSNRPLSVITATSIVLPCACLLIIPLDIYSVSTGTNSHGIHSDMDDLEASAGLVKAVYYMLYSSMIVWAFFILPLSFFFFKQEPEMTKSLPDCSQLVRPLKISGIFLLMLLVVIVFGILIVDVNNSRAEIWLRKLAKAANMGDTILVTVLSLLHLAGLFGWVVYGAFGLADLPSVLFEQKQAHLPVADDEAEIDRNLELVRAQRGELLARVELAARPWSAQDKALRKELDRDEKRLLQMKENLERPRDARASTDTVSVLWNSMRPFRIFLGILLVGCALLVCVSLAISAFERLISAPCGWDCGFLMPIPSVFNPIDLTFASLEPVFPLDFLLFGALIFYLFITALGGLVALGVRLAWMKVYAIRERRTSPLALLTGAWWLMLVVLAFNFEIVTLSPQYALFGSQHYAIVDNQTGVVGPQQRCTLHEVGLLPKQCIMTQMGTLITKYSLKLPWIAAISLGGDILFAFLTLLFTLLLRISMVKRCLRPPPEEAAHLFD